MMCYTRWPKILKILSEYLLHYTCTQVKIVLLCWQGLEYDDYIPCSGVTPQLPKIMRDVLSMTLEAIIVY